MSIPTMGVMLLRSLIRCGAAYLVYASSHASDTVRLRHIPVSVVRFISPTSSQLQGLPSCTTVLILPYFPRYKGFREGKRAKCVTSINSYHHFPEMITDFEN